MTEPPPSPAPARPVDEDPDKTVLARTSPGTNAPAGGSAPTTQGAPQGSASAPAPPVPPAGSNVLPNVLPVGSRFGEFEITGVIGEGGFGIVYSAHDHSLHRPVALKEYMPASFASRRPDYSVAVRSEPYAEAFRVGLRSFVSEARLLAQFDHPALVKVFRFWESNGTAYMVMPLVSGGTLKQALRYRERPSEAWLRGILAPLVDALETLHKANCLHRDISPDNILLVDGLRPLLLDFGAARHVIGDMTQALTVILKPGYAPIEQYDEIPGMKQGPWTDLYALAAVVHFAITGKPPPPSVGRLVRDGYEPLAVAARGQYSDTFLAAIDRALSPRPADRPQSAAEFRQWLGIGSSAPEALPPAKAVAVEAGSRSSLFASSARAAAPASDESVGAGVREGAMPSASRRSTVGFAITGAGVALFGGGALWAYLRSRRQRDAALPAANAPAPTVPAAVPTPTAITETVAPTPTPQAQGAEPSAGPAAAETKRPRRRPRPLQQPAQTAPAWIAKDLAEARECLVARRYTCTIERAQNVLKVDPDNLSAQRMLKLARAAQQEALSSDWKTR
jgi:hypothetical protein